MADVTIEKAGKRGKVPEDKLAAALAKGWVVAVDAPAAAPKKADHPAGPAAHGAEEVNEPAGPEEPEAQPSSPTKAIADAGRGFATGFSRWGSVGLDDTLSGLLTGGLEAASPTSASDEGDDVLTRMQKGYTVGRDTRRKKVERDYEASPKAYTAGGVTGVLSTLPLAPEGVAARRALAGAGSVALSDVDPLSLEGAGAAALGVVGGEVANKVLTKAAPVVGPVIARQLARVASPKAAGQALARKGADALEALMGKVDASPVARDLVGGLTGGTSNAVTGGARGTAKLLRALGGKEPVAPVPAAAEATTAPVAELSKAELAKLLEELNGVPAARAPAAAAPPAAPAVPAPVAAPVAPVAPPASAPPAAGGISTPALTGLDAEIQRVAVDLGTTDLATISQALKLPTTRVEGALRGLLRQFKFRDAVAKSPANPAARQTAAALDELAAEGAAPAARQAGDLMPPEAMEAIRRAKTDTPNALGFMDRPGNQVAAANQGAQMKAAFAALTPPQRAQFIQQLRASGMAEDVIRRRLGISQKAWALLAFQPR
jgi:hypothetical protein